MLKIGIIGLGLIGGSFGLAVKDSLKDVKILGFDKNQNHLKEAFKLGLIDKIASFDEIKDCDVITIAVPVRAIIKLLQELKDVDSKTTIIDFGSTKEMIINSTPKELEKNFVASHPMAGTEKFGPSAAFRELYRGRIVVLCDTDKNDNFHKQRAIDIFESIGMKIVYMDAKEHDRHAAYISHLPHAISYALANATLQQEEPKSIVALAAGGFKDMSRIAKSSPFMWSDIFLQNSKNLLHSIDDFENELKKLKELIKNRDEQGLKDWMSEANKLHNIL